jgi:hypothetical protein
MPACHHAVSTICRVRYGTTGNTASLPSNDPDGRSPCASCLSMNVRRSNYDGVSFFSVKLSGGFQPFADEET